MSDSPALALAFLASLVPVGIILLVSRLSGWQRLAEHYPARGPMPSRRRWFGYGVFRGWLGYNGGLVVAGDEAGLHLGALPVLLSFCHRPIFIPWSDLREIRRRRRWHGTTYALRTVHAAEVDFALRQGTFAFVRDHATRAGVPGDYA